MVNLVINFGGQPWQMNALKERLESKSQGNVFVINLTSEEMKGNLSDEKKEMLHKINMLSNVYIVDHANPNSTHISSAHYQELADFIAKHIVDDQVHTQASKLKFSLIACNAGTGEEKGLNSFAGLFHRYLGQEHKIFSEVSARNQVVMVNMHTKDQGKFTTSLLEYAVMNMAHDLPNFLYDSKDHMFHQKPGTKVCFQWDNNGDEWLVDSYIDKYIKRTFEILSLLEAENDFSQDELNSLKEIKDEIYSLIKNKSNETTDNVKKTDFQLEKIKTLLDKKEGVDGIKKLIKENMCLSRLSINEDSTAPIHAKYNVNSKPVEKERNIEKKIREDVITPVIDVLKLMPKTEKEKPIKKSCTSFLQTLSDISSKRLKKENISNTESNISKFIENIIINIIDDKKNSKEKISVIKEMKALIEDEILSQIKISPEITGAIEGFNDAKRLGGLSSLKALIPLLQIGSQQKAKEIEDLNNKMDAFIKASLDYVNLSAN